MKTSITKSNGKTKNLIIQRIVVITIWIGLWQMLYMIIGQDVLIPSPAQVIKSLAKLIGTMEFWLSTSNSLMRVLMGFIMAVLVGILLAVLTSSVPFAYDFLSPAISIVKATPVASFIILALIWLEKDLVSVFISFLMVLPMVWANISQGIAKTDKKLLEMGMVFNFSRMKTIRSIYIPSIMPYFIAAVTTGMGFAWKAGIAAEVLGMPKRSIGEHLYQAKIYLETSELFAWTVVVVLLSVLLENNMIKIIQHIGKKYNAGN